MKKTAAPNKLPKSLTCIFLSFWSLLILVNFVPAISQPAVIIGYLWKVEFALAAFLLVSIIFFLKSPDERLLKFTRTEFFWIILPLVLLTLWSGLSCLWAESWRAALHHTLLWACYCVFYVLMRQIVTQRRALSFSMSVTGIVVAVLGIVCLIEYFSTSAEYSVNVSLRYSKYAEAIAALFILFAALAVGKKGRNHFYFGAVAVIGWLGIVHSLGRTQFLAAVFAVFIFAIFALIRFGRGVSLKRAIIFSAIFISATVFSQIPAIVGTSQQTTLKRLSGDEAAKTSFQVRLLVWEIALENFRRNPILGVGADNFAITYYDATKNFAETHSQNQNSGLYEEALPERTHNEYLQILSELGIVGFMIFGWLLLGVIRLTFFIRKKGVSLLQVAALAGIFSFLVSSLASSYSFRVPANGLCFFFVLALAVKSFEFQSTGLEFEKLLGLKAETLRLKPTFAVFTILVCSVMLIFSSIRGAGLMYLQAALSSEDTTESEQNFQKAISLDDQDGLFRYYYGLYLYNQNRAREAVPQIDFAIDKGISTSIAFFSLASAQIVVGKTEEAGQTFQRSLLVYPRSVFLLTAYASFLSENGKDLEAQIEYEKAFQINAEQARSWRMAHSEGMKKLTQAENRDQQFVKVMELKPTDGVYALLDFQRQFNPNLVER